MPSGKDVHYHITLPKKNTHATGILFKIDRHQGYTSNDAHCTTTLRRFLQQGRNNQITFVPDMERIQNVIVKNARGHILFEHGQPARGEPSRVAIQPMSVLSPDILADFEHIDYGNGWPEVGSRLMNRLVTGDDMRPDGWVVVQPNVYRFAVMDHGQFVVRTVIREYLATEVVWEQD